MPIAMLPDSPHVLPCSGAARIPWSEVLSEVLVGYAEPRTRRRGRMQLRATQDDEME